jgi:hypothetical protein
MTGGIKVKTAFPGTTYQGLSTEDKPLLGPVSALASYREIDTGRTFYWAGTAWIEGDPIVQELRDIKGLLGAILENMNTGL